MKEPVYLAVTFIIVCAGLYMAFIGSPPPVVKERQPETYRIFFFHFPPAIIAYIGFAITFAGSILYLRRKDFKWDRIASSAAGLGVLACAMTILTGSIWAKEAWGVYWEWAEYRLTITLIMFFVYVAYLGFRMAIPEREKRARLSAVLGILAFALIPINYFAALKGIHPLVGALGLAKPGAEIGPLTRMTLYVCLAGFLLFALYLLYIAVRLADIDDRLKMIAGRAR